jgi:hypothetical protein
VKIVFSSRVLGNADTEHRIKVPILRGIVGLSARTCQKLGPDTKALSAEEANDLRKQVSSFRYSGFRVDTPGMGVCCGDRNRLDHSPAPGRSSPVFIK